MNIDRNRVVLVLIIFVAIVTKIPALSSWWCLDDWGQLGHAAGTITQSELFPARILSQHLFWNLTQPLFGLNPLPYTLIRIMFHVVSTVTVARLAQRAGMSKTGCLVSGCIFAASPISFTAIYWASGIQELMAGVFALLAVERWFSKEKANMIWPVIFGTCSILSKESAIALPFLFLGSAVFNRKNYGYWKHRELWVAGILLAVAIVESILILNHFGTGVDDPYRMGGLLVILGNLGKFGWWLLAQWPIFTGQVTWTLAGIGLGFWGLWLLMASFSFRRKLYPHIVFWVAAMSSLAPSLVLVNQTRPYMGYVAMACVSLAIGGLWNPKLEPKNQGAKLLLGLILFAGLTTYGFWSFQYRLDRKGNDSSPEDPVVRAMIVSRDSFESFKQSLPKDREEGPMAIVVFQQPLRASDIERSKKFGVWEIIKSDRYFALDGPVGLSYLTGDVGQVFWVNSLLSAPCEAHVFCEVPSGFQYWGKTRDALLNAALIDVLLGNYDSAQRQMKKAAEINNHFSSYHYDPELLALPMSVFQSRAAIFLEKLIMDEPGRLTFKGGVTETDYDRFLVLLKKMKS